MDNNLQSFLDEHLSSFVEMLENPTCVDHHNYIKNQLAMMLSVAYYSGVYVEQKQETPSLRELAKILSVDERYLLRMVDDEAPQFLDGDIPEFLRRPAS